MCTLSLFMSLTRTDGTPYPASGSSDVRLTGAFPMKAGMGNLQPARYPPIALSGKPGPTRTFPIKAFKVFANYQ